MKEWNLLPRWLHSSLLLLAFHIQKMKFSQKKKRSNVWNSSIDVCVFRKLSQDISVLWNPLCYSDCQSEPEGCADGSWWCPPHFQSTGEGEHGIISKEGNHGRTSVCLCSVHALCLSSHVLKSSRWLGLSWYPAPKCPSSLTKAGPCRMVGSGHSCV